MRIFRQLIAKNKCVVVGLVFAITLMAAAPGRFEIREGGIVRGPKEEKKIALEFTADGFVDGGKIILDELSKRKIKGAFFFTGNFLRKTGNKPIIERVIKEGHYLGPHSDTHPLLCPWEGPKKTLVSKEFFQNDLKKNLDRIQQFGVKKPEVKFFLPPFEWYNEEIATWTEEMGMTLINFSPGTRSSADYTESDAKNFVSSRVILESIFKKEKDDPNGLNGFLLLMHFGVSPKRTDKLADHFGELLDSLQDKGYQFVRVDELLK